MQKASMSTKGLRVLRDATDLQLAEWARRESQGSVLPDQIKAMREDCRVAVREAAERLDNPEESGEKKG